MNNFNDYAKNRKQNDKTQRSEGGSQSAFDMLKRVAKQYEGASENDLIAAIIEEANKSKQNGTLSEGEIQNFVNAIYPMLNEKQRKKLEKILQKIKD